MTPLERLTSLRQYSKDVKQRVAVVVGRLEPALEAVLRQQPELVEATARTLVEAHFPMTVAPDVLTAVGLDPDAIFAVRGAPDELERRRRSSSWPALILAAWDRQCAFCGYDGQLGSAVVGLAMITTSRCRHSSRHARRRPSACMTCAAVPCALAAARHAPHASTSNGTTARSSRATQSHPERDCGRYTFT